MRKLFSALVVVAFVLGCAYPAAAQSRNKTQVVMALTEVATGTPVTVQIPANSGNTPDNAPAEEVF